jgi:hypothetical protein
MYCSGEGKSIHIDDKLLHCLDQANNQFLPFVHCKWALPDYCVQFAHDDEDSLNKGYKFLSICDLKCPRNSVLSKYMQVDRFFSTPLVLTRPLLI